MGVGNSTLAMQSPFTQAQLAEMAKQQAAQLGKPQTQPAPQGRMAVTMPLGAVWTGAEQGGVNPFAQSTLQGSQHAQPPSQQQQPQQQISQQPQPALQHQQDQHSPSMAMPQQRPYAGTPSFVPAPPKSKLPLILGGVFALLAVIGIAGIVAFVVVSKSKGGVGSASASVSAPPPPSSVASTEPPPSSAATVVSPPPEDDASAAAVDTDPGADAAPEAAVAVNTDPNPNPNPNPTPVATKDAGPVDPNAWNEGAARARLAQANGILAFCNKGGVTGPGTATVTFAPDGSVSNVVLDAPFAETREGACVADQFKRAKVNGFDGGPQTIRHAFEVPK